MSPRQEEILRQANERYGEGVYFVYLRPTDKQLITMTIDHALLACPHIARESDSELWDTLDKWRQRAVQLETGYPDRFETSRVLGNKVLSLKGIEVE